MGVELAIASLIVTTAASANQAIESRKQGKLQKEARAVQSAEEGARLSRQKRRELRARRVSQARLAQSSVNTGVSGSSGELGAISSLSTNVAENRANIARQLTVSDSLSSVAQKTADSVSRSQISGAVGSISSSLFSTSLSNPDTAVKLKSIFTSGK